MALTRNFKETVLARIKHDPDFRETLLEERMQCLLSGDVEAGKSVLRDYIDLDDLMFERFLSSESLSKPGKPE